MIRQFMLTEGPSQEKLFDCLRLGQTFPELRVLEFGGEHRTEDGFTRGNFSIEIEGLHHASMDGTDWFFWGRCEPTSGEVRFAFGRWNVRRRNGRIEFGDTSFFVNPWRDEEGYYTEYLVTRVAETSPADDTLLVDFEGGPGIQIKKLLLARQGLHDLSSGMRVKLRGHRGNSITDLWGAGSTIAEILPA